MSEACERIDGHGVTRFTSWRDRFPGRIAGSVYTVPATERARTARDLAAAGVDVHVDMMASDEGLPDVLATRPGKVFLPWHSFTPERAEAVRAAGSAAWIALWDEWDGNSAPPWPAGPDGVLVMLIEPGTSGTCRLKQLAVVSACAGAIPVNVDGGVTEDVAPLCLTAGAETMVVGRALLSPRAGERKAI
jgi:pentose-5-phosphate-3-epimerase